MIRAALAVALMLVSGCSRPACRHRVPWPMFFSSDVLFAVGSCLYSGGLSRVAVTGGAARVLAAPRPGPGASCGDVCGERIAVTPDGGLIALVADRKLRLVDGQTGAVRRVVDLPAAAVDVLVRA